MYPDLFADIDAAQAVGQLVGRGGRRPAAPGFIPPFERNVMGTHSKDTSARVLRLTYSALYLAIALVLPFLTGQIPQIGSMLCPMHIPALLCGFVRGWPWGLAVGFIAPAVALRALRHADDVPRGGRHGVRAGGLRRGGRAAFTASCPKDELHLRRADRRDGRRLAGLPRCAISCWRGLKHQCVQSSALFWRAQSRRLCPASCLHIVLIPVLVMAMEKA